MTTIVSNPHVDPRLINAFFGLQLGGELGMFIIVLTAIGSPHVKRNTTWYTFCFAWILSCISYTFIFLIGQQTSPSFGACVTQAAGIYSAPILTTFATVAFALDMLLGVRAATTTQILPSRRYSITLALLIVPFFIWLLMFVGFLSFGLNNPALVKMGPNGTYCDLDSFTPSKISGLIVVVGTVLILVIEGYIATRLFKNRNLLQDRRFVAMAIRVMIFSLLGALGLGIGFAYVLFSEQGPAFDLITALLPIGAVVIFGTHLDLLDVWIFWRRPRSDSRQNDDIKSTSSSIISVPTPRSWT
ncbi:hypothetical protein DFH08DRAFT_4833 [Mycena albidolilacea]|uniref:Uncharacterized protein n=1 Tax=Mycena albidolilacea TaxID=1033008 RepID=A0AAD7F5R8_9AGAR|nr:hypothetical protein DFH08DRAFT_4833 [Mycena albidolilacea]